MNYSPLRYPGGKSKITPFVSLLIEKSNLDECTYVEPFAGGAGVALSLLFDGTVTNIVINDYDKAIYSMWKAILEETEAFINLVQTAPLTIDEWRKQKQIYNNQNKKYSLELGFATFYLNRTNRSGILAAGPIGGYKQTGNYLMDARYNREVLIKRIKKIAEYKSHIHLYNKDIESFMKNYLPKYLRNAFVYFDPPYVPLSETSSFTSYTKDGFNIDMQFKLRDVCDELDSMGVKFLLSNSDTQFVNELYENYNIKKVFASRQINANAEGRGKITEVLVRNY